jgi:hypothetical protein
MSRILLVVAFISSVTSALAQQTFDLHGLSQQDLLTIGAGLDKLPREATDDAHGGLYSRIQAQITAQVQAAIKAAEAAQKAAIDKAVEERTRRNAAEGEAK